MLAMHCTMQYCERENWTRLHDLDFMCGIMPNVCVVFRAQTGIARQTGFALVCRAGAHNPRQIKTDDGIHGHSGESGLPNRAGSHGGRLSGQKQEMTMVIDYSKGKESMDYPAREKTYKGFVRLVIATITLVALILIGMAVFLL